MYSYLLKNAAKVPHDRSKSDVFSFGLCLLEAGLLRDVQDVYDEEQNWVNTDLLDSYIDEFCLRQFNTHLSELLKKCLDFVILLNFTFKMSKPKKSNFPCPLWNQINPPPNPENLPN